MPGFDLLITWATSGFLKAITNGYSQGSGSHLGSPHQHQLPVFHYMNFPVSESMSYIDSYCFSIYGHQQEAQKQLGQKETAKQQSLLSLGVREDSWYNVLRKNNQTCQFGFMGTLNQTSLPGISLAETCNSLMFTKTKEGR